MKRGAWHYVVKPVRLDELALHARRASEHRTLRKVNHQLRGERRHGLAALVGKSEVMRELYALIERVALLESELFGHTRGAFTGATSARAGLFVEASGGTLFLDEIGDMAPALQAKLLRAVQEGEVRPVGSDESRAVDVRVIAATHHDLAQLVADGRFRQDLFYRLDVVPITLPPLRERPADVPMLVEHFLAAARARNPHSPVVRFSAEVLTALSRYTWPGNVRELENLIERLVVVGAATEVGLPELTALAPAVTGNQERFSLPRDRLATLRELEEEYIAWMIERCGGNKTKAAELLGIDPSTLHRRTRPRR
jgi:two-component system response regulator HydG